MTQSKAASARHQQQKENDDVSKNDNSRTKRRNKGRPRKSKDYDYTPKPGTLLQRRNYSLLRLLTIINAAGSNGITTLKLLDELGSRADRINAIIRKAEEEKLIERIEGPSEKGRFSPILNKLLPKGKKLLVQLHTQKEK